ncbi:MAG: T9SS type A sorting domain-containing protein [Bacteroidales bacterium]|nr:T9SS type A sorting domain-containing protein [Bacteroidales bacterium]
MKSLALRIALSSFILLFLSGIAEAQTATIDLSGEKQVISGFGGMNMPGWIDDLTPDQVDKAFGNDPGQIGLSILRVRVPWNTGAFNLEVPGALRAKSHGAIVMASPWTPPPSMKTNNNIIGGSLDPSYYSNYADHLISFADHMASGGVPLYAISVQNEPDIQVDYESCDWTPTEMINFLIGQGEAFDSLRLIVAESYNFNKSKTDPILNNTSAEPFVDIIGGHIYGGGLSDYPLARDKGKEVWMTEHLETTTDWAGALATGKEIHDCMNANYNAYIWWYIRRFYGLIDESGNISKRGYVMSQFAKFVRPGSIRVDATASPVMNVDVTAYKNDTNVVIVIVNRNPVTVDLEMILQNGSVSSFAKFTTSGNKNILNDGTINVSGNSFSATFDAQSVTTLTSFAGHGGSASNDFPQADAGSYEEFTDEDNNGSETIMLDGSASTDPDGMITGYTWAEDGYQIASGEKPTIDLATGTHTITLTVTDNDGATDTEEVNIVIGLGGGTNEALIWLEAECGTVGSNWNILSDNNASNEEFVIIQSGNNSVDNASESEDDHIILIFNITEAGNYILWGRIRVPSADDDSFWIKMDEGTWVKWNSISGGLTWGWDEVHNSDMGSQVVSYNLGSGLHTLAIAYREDGAALDKLFLSNTGTSPSGTGGLSENCEGGSTGINLPEINIDGTRLIGSYPNPFTGITEIEFSLDKTGHVTLELLDITGRKVSTLLNSVQQPGKYEVPLDGRNLESGIYFCRLLSGEYDRTIRLILNK